MSLFSSLPSNHLLKEDFLVIMLCWLLYCSVFLHTVSCHFICLYPSFMSASPIGLSVPKGQKHISFALHCSPESTIEACVIKANPIWAGDGWMGPLPREAHGVHVASVVSASRLCGLLGPLAALCKILKCPSSSRVGDFVPN